MTLNIITGESGTDFSGGNSRPPQREQMNNRDQKDSGADGGKHRSGSVFRLMPRLLAGLLAVVAVAPCQLWAQTKTAKPAPPSDRCLLIVETSKPMKQRSETVLGAVRGLLTSGLNDQLRDGSTLGVWTYNEDLYAGRFPLQTWSSSARKDITQRTLAFLKGQKYEKQANFHKVAPALGRVIKDSELITVVLISSGDHEVRGTPFDDQINTAYRRWSSQQQQARMPFVTVFCARNGQIANYVVNTPPWPLEMPRLPPETKSAEVVREKLVEAVRKPQTSSVPPLIISGKKPQPEQGPTPKPEPVIAKPEAPPTVATAASTSEPAMVKPPGPTAPPAEIAKTESAPAVTEKPATEPAPKPSLAPKPAPEPKAESVNAPAAKPVEPTPSKSEPALPPPAPEPKPEPASLEQPTPSPAREVKIEPVPAPPATPAGSPETTGNTTGAASALSRPSPLPVPPAQTATAVPDGTLASHKTIWVAGLVLAVVAVGFTILLLRRSRAATGASLITRSLERKNKP
jgi:hypothetical protein